MPPTISFGRILHDARVIKASGKKIDDLLATSTDIENLDDKPKIFALVYGVSLFGRCIRYNVPRLMLLPEVSHDPDEACPPFNDSMQYVMWILDPNEVISSFSHSIGSAQSLLQPPERLNVDFDFRVHDVYQYGQFIMGRIRAYLHLYQSGSIPSIPILDWTVVDTDMDFTLDMENLNLKITIVSGVVLTFQYYPPNTLCADVSVSLDLSHYGIGQFDRNFNIACVTFPIDAKERGLAVLL